MKKTLIALLALSSLALGEAENISLTLPGSYDSTEAPSLQAATWEELIDNHLTANYGFYFGAQGGDLSSLNKNEGKWVVDANGTSGQITMCGRSGVGGEAIALVLGEDAFESGSIINSITMTASNKDARPAWNGTITLGLAVVDDSGELILSAGGESFTNKAAGNSNSQTLISTEGIKWQEGYKIIAVIDGPVAPNGNFNDTDCTINNITVTANVTAPIPTPAVPEPTTATLSLLALAGLAARRRRK